MADVRIYNNGLGPIHLPPPKHLPKNARAGLRQKLQIAAGGSISLDEGLWVKIALHRTVRPYVASGVLATRPLRVERRKPAASISDEELQRALARKGTPLDLYVGLVPDPALQRLADGGRESVPVSVDFEAMARSNAMLTEQVHSAEQEIERLRAALAAKEAELANAPAAETKAAATLEAPAAEQADVSEDSAEDTKDESGRGSRGRRR